MKKIFGFLFIVLSFHFSNAQIIKNGHFEMGPNYWTNGNAEFTAFAFDNTVTVLNHYFDVTPLNTSGNGAFIEQKIQIDTACTYSLRFQVRPSNDNNKTAGFDIYVDGVKKNTAPITANDPTNWTVKISPSFPLTTGSHTVRFVGNNGLTSTPRVMGIDNIELVKGSDCVPCNCGEWRGFAYTIKTTELKNELALPTEKSAGKFILCGQTIVLGKNNNLLINPAFYCSGSCQTSYTGIVKFPNGTSQTLNSFPYQFSQSAPGYYTITVTPKCGDKVCQPCVFRVFVTPGCNGDILTEKVPVTE